MALSILKSGDRGTYAHPAVALPAAGVVLLLVGVVFPGLPRLLIAFAVLGPALIGILAFTGGVITRDWLMAGSVLPFFTAATLLIRRLSRQPER